MLHVSKSMSLTRLVVVQSRPSTSTITNGRTSSLWSLSPISRTPPSHPTTTCPHRCLNIDSNYVNTTRDGHGHSNRRSKKSKDNTKRSRGRQSYRFVDRTRVQVSGGMGGKGSLSMLRIGRKQNRRPDGGHGGNGGSVLILADPNEQSLRWTRPHVTADAGVHGTSQDMHGRNGRNTVLRVPCGVVVRRVLDDNEFYDTQSKTVKRFYQKLEEDDVEETAGYHLEEHVNDDAAYEPHHVHARAGTLKGHQSAGYLASNDYDSDEDEDSDFEYSDSEDDDNDDNVAGSSSIITSIPLKERQRVEIADLDEPGSYVVVARGGRGGLGSSIFSSKHGPLPATEVLAKYATPQEGETALLELELKLIADIGLVGFPNAGKSSLLAATSRATPHIAPYPFTTLNPLVGYIEYKDGFRVCAADVPGLIAGASEGRGKGHDFLRHLERTKALLYIVDAAGVDGRDPIHDFETLVSELEAYGDGDMLNRRCLVVANKLDLLLQDERQEILDRLQKTAGQTGIRLVNDVIGISAGVTGEGLSILTKAIRQTVLSSENDKVREQNLG